MTETDNRKLLFVVNPGSGSNTTDWPLVIKDYFSSSHQTIDIFELTKNCNLETIKERIRLFAPHCVVAVGGDGTIKLVAECLLHKNIQLGILPAGSANGLAKELRIDADPIKALEVLVEGHIKKIHIININDHLCIHLSDIGLNAYMIKEFESQKVRGMWGYLRASLKVLWQNPRLDIEMQIDKKTLKLKAEMIVIANATKYGSGVVINPIGTLEDEWFEVIALKQITPYEIFKTIFLRKFQDSLKTEIFQTDSFIMRSRRKVHFQVDGEYLGKVKEVKATIIRDALEVIVPKEAIKNKVS